MIYQSKYNWEAPCKSVVYSLRKYNDFLNYKENTSEFVIFVKLLEEYNSKQIKYLRNGFFD